MKSLEHWNKTKFTQKRSSDCHRKANEMNLTHEKLFLCASVYFKANINDERFDKKRYTSIHRIHKVKKERKFHLFLPSWWWRCVYRVKCVTTLTYSSGDGWCRTMWIIRPGGYNGLCNVNAIELSLGCVLALRAVYRS